MLVIGDLNIKNTTNIDVEIINKEYVCQNKKEIDEYVKLYNLKPDNLIFNNNLTYTYHKNNMYYSFYDSSTYLILESLSTFSGNNSLKPKYANKLMEWVTCKVKLKFIHKNVYSWSNRVETYLNLNNQLQYSDVSVKNFLQMVSNGLTSWVINNFDIDKNTYQPRKFDTYDKEDLYNLFSFTGNSQYLSLLFNPYNLDNEIIVQENFDKMNNDKKIFSVMEKLYVECTNNYIIPYIKDNHKFPENLFELFLKTFNNIISIYQNYNFNNFAIHNYLLILEYFDESMFTSVLYYAIKNEKMKTLNDIKIKMK